MLKTNVTPRMEGARALNAPEGREVRSAGIPARIAEQIREMIVRGALSPGVHLGQMQLADQFEASRVPVREALKLLSSEGLLVHDPNRGFFVASLSSDEARQLYRMRYLVESELLENLEWPDEKQLAELDAMVDDMVALLEKGDRATWAVRHRQFHSTIYELSPQKVLVREVLRLRTLTDRYRSLLPTMQHAPGRGEALDERNLVEALRDKDRKRLLNEYQRARIAVEELLLGILQARHL